MLRFIFLTASFAVAGLSQPALAETVHPHQPYAPLQSRAIKALSDDQISDLEAGRGMGFALSAELNGYPGPRHVLDFAERLGLTQTQLGRTEALFASMQAETIYLGKNLILQERLLDQMFADKVADRIALSTMAAEIGETQGKLRAAHLRYHLTMAELLTPQQVKAYAQLRGYGEPSGVLDNHDSRSHAH